MAQLQWRDDSDAYKPINYSLNSFLESRGQLTGDCQRRESFTQQVDYCSEMLVFVTQSAQNRLINHLSIDPNTETGGVLIGNAYYCATEQKHYTEIIGSISAPYTVGNRVHFRFTPECWQEILKVQKDHYPQTTIVGWYHSHPGHGIFLSGTDLNTQRLSFGKIWQIATVYDPIRQEIGYFYGEQGKRLDPIYLHSPTFLSSEGTVDSSARRELELPQLPEHEVVSPQDVSVEASAFNLELENFTQNGDQRQNPKTFKGRTASIYERFNCFCKQLLRHILRGRR